MESNERRNRNHRDGYIPSNPARREGNYASGTFATEKECTGNPYFAQPGPKHRRKGTERREGLHPVLRSSARPELMTEENAFYVERKVSSGKKGTTTWKAGKIHILRPSLGGQGRGKEEGLIA